MANPTTYQQLKEITEELRKLNATQKEILRVLKRLDEVGITTYEHRSEKRNIPW